MVSPQFALYSVCMSCEAVYPSGRMLQLSRYGELKSVCCPAWPPGTGSRRTLRLAPRFTSARSRSSYGIPLYSKNLKVPPPKAYVRCVPPKHVASNVSDRACSTLLAVDRFVCEVCTGWVCCSSHATLRRSLSPRSGDPWRMST